jgi:hypothetical protein
MGGVAFLARIRRRLAQVRAADRYEQSTQQYERSPTHTVQSL